MYPPMEFKDAAIWITGASSGIGEALARQMAGRGSKLALSARNKAELDRVAEACREHGASEVMVLPLDVTDYDAAPEHAAKVQSHLGSIDLLINNAGVSQRSFCVDTDFSVYRKLLDVDVLGQIALTQAVLPIMIRQGSGHIAVTASVAGKIGAPMRTGYCAAKHAVMGFFDALRCEIAADGLRVTTIVPGFIKTNVSRNALNASGESTGATDEDIAGGMDVEACAEAIIAGFLAGTPEIAVGQGPEMQFLELKAKDPIATFKMAEAMAAQVRERAENA